MSEAISPPGDTATWWAKTLLVVAAAVLVGLPLAALGYRWGLWGLGPAFTALRYLLFVAVAGIAVMLVGGAIAIAKGRRKSVVVIAHALAMTAIPAAFVFMQYRAVQGTPPIHDITTDGNNPPMFSGEVVGMPQRSMAYDRTVYDQQRTAYPDIKPIVSSLSAEDAYAKALATATNLGWVIARKDDRATTFEAVDTTFWFGFKDDVIVRVRPHPQGSIVDVRSVSRIGRSDLGKNADRIRDFVEAFG